MEYRKLPHGNENLSVLGLGMGGIQNTPAQEIEAVVSKAISSGINFFDLCAGGAGVYAPFGRAIKDKREKIHFQLHFGAVYNDDGEYGWSRDLYTIRRVFDWEMETLSAGYVDFGFLHCVDEESDIADIEKNNILRFVSDLKDKGIVRHLGFSSHTPSVADKLLGYGLFDMMMFSLNPAYDLEKGDEYGIGTAVERANLLKKCESLGVGVSVMKPFHGGQLLDGKTSPFGKPLTKNQCIQYALDRPAVLSVVPGVRNLADLSELLKYPESDKKDNDYSVIAGFTPESAAGRCVYCNHCQPCPAGIDIGLVNKYYDLSLAGDRMAENHYSKLKINASACLECGHCVRRCPFSVDQQNRMKEIADYFDSARNL